MKILIAYGTKHGFTGRCASILSQKLDGTVELINLKEKKNIELSQYDKIIIGGSVYMGQTRKEVKEFCVSNLNKLKDKKIGLFICCMQTGELAEKEISTSFPEELMKNAAATGYFGGEFSLQNSSAFERFIMKMVAKTKENISTLSEESIGTFAEKMNSI